MNNLNSVLIEGNLVRDPEERLTSNDTKVYLLSLATNRFYKKDEDFVKEVSYFDIEVWGARGERCKENLTKGRSVRVVGRLKQDRWVNDDGQNRNRIKIVAEHVEFTNSKNVKEEVPQEVSAN